MAKAEKTTVTTETITLTLSMEEARALHVVTGRIAGLSARRSATDRVFYALEGAGVEDYADDAHGVITFTDVEA